MDTGRHIQIFDLIAPVYAWFFNFQVRNYRRSVSANPALLGGAADRILDIGCGTGALVHVLAKMGHQVTGLDGSARMIALARRLNRSNQARFYCGDALDLDQVEPKDGILPEQEFDIVVASYVLHGLQKEQRQRLYVVMKQLASKRVIIMDYNRRRSILTSLVEWLEQGDYFNFIRSAEAEMRQVFSDVQVVNTGKRAAWYVCQ